jgi:hypothetical protein
MFSLGPTHGARTLSMIVNTHREPLGQNMRGIAGVARVDKSHACLDQLGIRSCSALQRLRHRAGRIIAAMVENLTKVKLLSEAISIRVESGVNSGGQEALFQTSLAIDPTLSLRRRRYQPS